MSVYKEMGYLVRKIESQSKRIYGDACDYGMPIYSIDDPIIKETISVMEMYDVKPSTVKYSTGTTQTFIFSGDIGARCEAGFSNAIIEYVTASKRGTTLIGYLTAQTSTPKHIEEQAQKYLN